MRREFSGKVMAQAALRANGYCEGCTRRLLTGDFHYDHRIPDSLGGEPTLDNCQVLCRSCHSTKTAKADVPNIARAKRRHKKHIGIRKRSSFPCSKASPFKKKIGGEVVRRNVVAE